MNKSSFSFAEIEHQFLQSNANILSLDCFDTLYWRNVSRPFDIFTQIHHGLCPSARSRAEATARGKKLLTTGKEEATLAEIYAELADHFTPDEQAELIERELALEIEHGFIFAPALALLRQAKARGMRTLIVSDTYYSAEQLRRLLSAHCRELAQLVDHIYCSAEYGHGKSTRLWPAIIQQEKVPPEAIFHAGDNLSADFTRPAALGIHAVHFRQNEPLIAEVQEQRVIAAGILFPASRHTAVVPSLFHACYSTALRGEIAGETLTAWTLLGPVMYAFARFIREQREKHPAARLGFLMRDGYMPHKAYQALYPDDRCATLRISRLTSICSAFHDQASIVAYLAKMLGDSTRVVTEKVTPSGFAMMARHLMLSRVNRQKIKSQLEKHHYSADYLYNALLAPQVIKETLSRSAAMRARLIAHLNNELQLQPGETLMLVDLGYTGTTQNLLGPLLEKALSITVTGCYLIATWVAGWHKNRTAMVNPDSADFRFIRMLTQFIMPFEMLCSSHDFSVTDYTETGHPVAESESLPPPWLPRIRQIQEEALRCVTMAADMGIPASRALWDAAAIDLARYIYLPLAEETRLLADLEADINMGTDAIRKVVDIPQAIDYMRRYGVTRLTMAEGDDVRTSYPSELRACSIDYAVSFMTSIRYALNWSLTSTTQRHQALEVLFVENAGHAESKILHASSTADGYFSLYIPFITPETAVLAGKTFADIEIYSVALIPQSALYKQSEQQQAQPLLLNQDFFIDGATVINNLALEMQDGAFIYLRPRQTPKTASLLHLIYRPINEKHVEDNNT